MITTTPAQDRTHTFYLHGAPGRGVVIFVRVHKLYLLFALQGSNEMLDVHSNVRVTEYLGTFSLHSGELMETFSQLIPFFVFRPEGF